MLKNIKRIGFLLLKIAAWIVFGILLLFFSATMVLRLPSVQTFLIHKVTSFISSKTHTKLTIEEIQIVFPRSVVLKQLFAEDEHKDTLIHIGSLDAKINLFSLLHKEINISRTEIKDVQANMHRRATDSSFNFQFIINAFVPASNKSQPKDTTKSSSPLTFSAGEVALENVKFNLMDSLGGILLQSKLDNLEIDADLIDLQKMRFEVNSFKLSHAKGTFEILELPAKPSTSKGKTIPLHLSANKIELENIDFQFINQPSKQNMKFKLGKSYIRNSSFDLPTLTAKVGRFDLSKSKVDIAMEINTASSNSSLPIAKGKATENSPFNVDAEIINLQQNEVKLDLDKNKAKSSGIDFQHLQGTNINLKARKSHYSWQNIKADIQSFSVKERSGLEVRHFATKFTMDTRHAEAKNLYLQTSRSKISRYASIRFHSWDDLSNHIGELKIKADFKESVIDLKDIIPFHPDLLKIDIIKKNLNQPIKVSGLVNGALQDISFEQLSAAVGKHTTFEAKGHITGLPTIDNTKFDIVLSSFHTSHHDINAFLPSTLLSAFQLPDTISANGAFKGTISDFEANIKAHTSDGDLQGEVAIKDLRKLPIYKGKVDLNSLNIGKILRQKPLLGKATLYAKVDGTGFTTETMDVKIDTQIDSLFLNQYTYTQFNIKGEFKKKLFVGHADMNDPNLNFVFDGKINTNKKINEYNFDLDIQGADLQNLKLTDQDIRMSAVAAADIKAPAFDNMNGTGGIKNIILYSDGKKYEVDSLVFVSFNDDKRSSLDVNSAILKAKFDGNISLGSLPNALFNHFNYYFRTGKTKSGKPEHFSFEIDITNSPLIYEVLVPKLKDFVPGKITGSFDSETHKLDFDANMLNINYAGNKLENLIIGVHSNPQSMDYSIGIDQFTNSQMVLQQTLLSGSIKNDAANINLSVIDVKKKNKLNINSQITSKQEGIYLFNILPKGFVINDENWTIPETNLVEFGKNGTFVQNMILEKLGQKIDINSTSKNKEADLNIVFKDFQLKEFSQIVERDEPIARGKLDGSINFKKYHTQFAFVSDLTIDKAEFKGNSIGNLTLKADNLYENKYSLSALIHGNDNDITLKGYLQGHPKGMLMNLDLRLNKLNLSSFQGFVSNEATRVSGSATGDIKVTGETSEPQVNGEITLRNAAGQITMLNQYLTIAESKISIDPKGVYFPNLILQDAQKNSAVVKGSVGMKNFKDYKYNIDIETDHFTLMNSNRKNNKMLNGKMIVSSNIKIRGNNSKPDIEARVKLDGGSNVCFTVPENQLSADKGEGVVVFDIDTIKLNPIIRRAVLQKKSTSEWKGINLVSNIELNRRSTLKLVLDPTQSDTLIVKGDANLSFAMDESGKMSLSGTYIVSEGSYELSLQDIVNKKFLINKGSTLTWSGDPLDAQIDITAQYNVRTSPADLLASGTTGKVGLDPSAAKNALNFYVKIFIKGDLLKPNLKFSLDMDPSQQQALGGTVYAKINELNTNESELDKQVFSLLVIGSFMPTSNSSGGGTDYSGIARSSASSILSSQLNALSAQYIKGVELNFDLQSYNDYASGQKSGNTQLSVGLKKQFLSDKLSVQIGSNIGLEGQKASQNNLSNFTGNMVIEYKLTKDGSYRLKAFRQNQYEGLIYGVVIKTGAGIIYSRDYNKFSEIFKRRKRKKETVSEK